MQSWFSATRIVGLAAYGVSCMACSKRALAGGSTRPLAFRSRLARPYAWLAGAQAALLLDMAFDWRWRLHAMAMEAASSHGLYTGRRLPQTLALAALLVLAAALALRLWHLSRRRAGLALSIAGTLLSAELWWAECISLHAVDAVLYRHAGPFMTVSFFWAATGALTTAGALLELLQSNFQGRGGETRPPAVSSQA